MSREKELRAALERIKRKAMTNRCNGCGESKGGELADTCDACCALVDIQNTAKDALAAPLPDEPCAFPETPHMGHECEHDRARMEAERAVIEAAKSARYAYFSAGRGKKEVPARMMALADAISTLDLCDLTSGSKEGA